MMSTTRQSRMGISLQTSDQTRSTRTFVVFDDLVIDAEWKVDCSPVYGCVAGKALVEWGVSEIMIEPVRGRVTAFRSEAASQMAASSCSASESR